jgi:hypothetical protein
LVYPNARSVLTDGTYGPYQGEPDGGWPAAEDATPGAFGMKSLREHLAGCR